MRDAGRAAPARRRAAASALVAAFAALTAGPPATRAAGAGSSAPADSVAPYPVRELAPGAYAVPGDSGRGVEGRANAGFVVTSDGVVAIDALGSPHQGRRLVASIRSVTDRPLRWLVLTHHHPDHAFGASALRQAGALVIAHPDAVTQAGAAGDSALVADWTRVVGFAEMGGFTFADRPDMPLVGDTTLTLGGTSIVIEHPGPAHTPGDLFVWLPRERVLYAGDLLVEDGVTMVGDGDSAVLLAALERIEALRPARIVPGHGRIPDHPMRTIGRTRGYIEGLRTAMRAAFEAGESLNEVVAALPVADPDRPVSLASRRRRNAVRVYLEMEREGMGVEPAQPAPERASAADPAPSRAETSARSDVPPPTVVSTADLASLLDGGEVTLLDVRVDFGQYLQDHLPGAVYLNTETLRAEDGGVPNLLLPRASYATLFSRLGVRLDRPVVIYGSGEARNIDATYVAWILHGFGHGDVRVLDGGYAKWQLEGRALTRKYPRYTPSEIPSGDFEPERATLEDVRAALGKDGVVLVDARPPDQYAGDAGSQIRLGHIPGAVNHFWQTDLAGDFAKVWKAPDEIRAAYVAQGITPDKRVIAYCNGGLESSHVYFTLRALLGYPDVRVYDGSWTEWSEREELPIETGARDSSGGREP
jgi:thiosulfate/3-mercaptopyruvate sulfurtransferase